jgi:hypothetical protein
LLYPVQSRGDQFSIRLLVVRKGSMANNHRALVLCPHCDRSRSGLVLFRGEWRCRTCHGLGYRSAMIGTPARNAETVRRLKSELEDLKRDKAQPRRIMAKQEKLTAARSKLRYGEHVAPHEGFSRILTCSWEP